MNKQSIVISKYGYNKKNYSSQHNSNNLSDRISRDINLRINNSQLVVPNLPDVEFKKTSSPTPNLPDVEFSNSQLVVPNLPDVEFKKTSSPTPNLPDVEFKKTSSPTPNLPDVEFKKTSSPTPNLPDVEFKKTSSPTPNLPDVEFSNSQLVVPNLPDVEFSNSQLVVPNLPDVEFKKTSSNNKKIVEPSEALIPSSIIKKQNDTLNVSTKQLITNNDTIQKDGFAMEQDILDLFITEVNEEILIPE